MAWKNGVQLHGQVYIFEFPSSSVIYYIARLITTYGLVSQVL